LQKHTLLQQLFTVYGRASKAVKQAVHRHIPKLFRTIGSSSPELLQLIADPPAGSENLLLLVLHSLTEGTEPSAELIGTVKKLYETKLQDAAFLIPVLSSLSKEEVAVLNPAPQ
jgi:symplekin